MVKDEEVLAKRQEAKVRRLAVRFGYRVCKSRQRSNVPNLDNHGNFTLLDAASNYPVLGSKFDATLEDIEGYLTGAAELKQWLADRKEAAKRINIATCEITWNWGEILDPYGVRQLTPEEQQIGRLVFVRSPESGGWVSLYDLPQESARALHQRIDMEGIPDNDDWLLAGLGEADWTGGDA